MSKFITVLPILIFFPLHVQSEQTFEVKDDLDNGVASKIYFQSESNHRGDTDKSGVFISKNSCVKNTPVIAKPNSPLYESGRNMCPKDLSKLVVRVTWKPVYSALINNRDYFIQKGDFGAAALASNEIAARSISVKTVNENYAKTILLLGKHFNLKQAALGYDPQQNAEVATPAMIEAVKIFQKDNGLTETGLINYKTLSIAADRDIGSLMFQEFK